MTANCFNRLRDQSCQHTIPRRRFFFIGDMMFINPLAAEHSIKAAIRAMHRGGMVLFREHDWLILGTDQRAEISRLAWFYGVILVSAEELGIAA